MLKISFMLRSPGQTNELAQVALRQELENAAEVEAQREKHHEVTERNEDFAAGTVLTCLMLCQLHQRPACTDASDCRQRLPESSLA